MCQRMTPDSPSPVLDPMKPVCPEMSAGWSNSWKARDPAGTNPGAAGLPSCSGSSPSRRWVMGSTLRSCAACVRDKPC